MYFELTIDVLHEYGIKEPQNLPFSLNFLSGEIISEQIENPLIFTTNATVESSPPDFYAKSFPIMSKKLVSLLESAGVGNIQKFAVIVKSEIDGTIWEDYNAVNILGLIKCTNLSKSVYSEIFPGNYSFKKLAIDIGLIKGVKLFRLQESPSTIIIHKSIAKHIVDNDPDELITGWDIYDIIQ